MRPMSRPGSWPTPAAFMPRRCCVRRAEPRLHKGQIALDERGLVGRITEVGSRTARVLLITDMNSRVPVILESSRSHAILAGTNGPWPRLLYLVRGHCPQGRRAGRHSAEAGLPPYPPVGMVRCNANGVPEISA